MTILLFFAFLAGMVTVLSPCVLPILPALLSAGAGRGHLRPIGIILGLICSFTFFTLMLTTLVQLTGISPDFLRYVAIALIAGFGLLMIFPSLGEQFASATSGVASLGQSVQVQSTRLGSGFWGGFVLGIALGLVWTPCAGPILGAITTLVATSSVTWPAFLITLSYSLGAAIPMLAIIYGGKKILSVTKDVSGYSEAIRKGFGALMILAALSMAFHYDVVFQAMATKYLPFIDVENNKQVKQELDKLRTVNPEFIVIDPDSLEKGKLLPEGIAAPDIIGIKDWVNTKPLSLEQLKGKVVLVDFWTYSCINCIRTLPYMKELFAKYKDDGFVLIGVHTPEFEFEKNKENVKEAVKRFGVEYPVAIDSQFKTWQNYNNRYWPAHYLIDQKGDVRSVHFGEGDYVETENAIRELLGLKPIQEKASQAKVHHSLTPETYLGFDRAQSYASSTLIKPNQTVVYEDKTQLRDDQVGLRGDWLVEEQKITAEGDLSELDFNFLASQVYLVMESQESQHVTVYMDGKPLPHAYATEDMKEDGQIVVKEARKYDVIDLKNDYGRHTLTLKVPKGVSLYAFTFGGDNE